MSNSNHILCVITGCGGGDWPPLLALASGLHQCGYEVVVVCDVETEDTVEAAGLKALCVPQNSGLETVFEPALEKLMTGSLASIGEIENPFTIWGGSCADYVVQSLAGSPPSLVITSLFGMGLGDILAERFSIKRCFLNPSFCFGESTAPLSEADFSDAGREMYEGWLLPLVKRADLVLHATDKTFDTPSAPLPSNHKYVGPLFWEMIGNEQDLLKHPGPPWVLITLSTSPQPGDVAIVKTALKSLQHFDVRILVTLAPGHNKAALEQIDPNVHVTGYIPHSSILPHCCLVISHAGHGIVMKSMTHGIPMVLVPWGRDQPGVGSRAERLGVAVVVPRSECSADTLLSAIKTVLGKQGFAERCRGVSSGLRSIDSVAKTIGYIEQVL